MVLLDTLYINNSGGKVLLDYLVDELEKANADIYYLFDSRIAGSYALISDKRKVFVKATIYNRLIFYFHNRRKYHKILCFANIPPPLFIKNSIVYTYLHNVLLLSYPRNQSLNDIIRIKVRRLFLNMFLRNTDFWIVQSSNMVCELSCRLHIKKERIMSIPFFKNSTCVLKNQREDSFIYPCTGSGHKNTLRLLLAWEALYNQGYQPALHLTISYEWPNLIAKISALNHKGLKIINHGTLAQKELLKLYSRTKYMIYPSLAESFGLPLIEAAKSGCKIIASDLPFTYAVVHPSLTFNPYDVKSIKEAIITCLQKEVPPSKCIINDEIQSLLSLVS